MTTGTLALAEPNAYGSLRHGSHPTVQKKGQADQYRIDLPLPRPIKPLVISYALPLPPKSSAPHFFAVASNTSLLDSATGGKSFIHS
jgi:hypothetical protein